MDDPLIGPADTRDAAAVFGLLRAFATSYPADRAAFDRHYPALLAAPGADLLVARSPDRTVIGYALAWRTLVLYANGAVTELHELMVDPACRGRGVGGALVGAVLDRARAAGSVEVTVPTRRAREFYLRLGFTETATYLKRRP